MSAAVDEWLGKTIEGRYVLRRRIGRGGMGVVYEAEHAKLDRRVAIKLIALKDAPEAYLTRFRREAKLASRITHEHLVHIYDVGTDLDTGADYIVMEYVEGRDLGHELDGGPLAISRTISIARQLLHGLHAIHEGGIIHRDIKPGNVMLTTRSGDRDFVKLMDFGIARAVGDASLTVTGLVVGTPNFMSPEQLRGQEVDRRTDLYAVGVTMFAMISGRLPFEGNTAMLAGAHVFQPPPSLAKLRPETPPALIAAVERALAKSAEDRFPDALAFAKALDAERPVVAAATATTPSVPTVVDRPRTKRSPSHAPLIAAAVAAAAVIAGVIWYLQRPEAADSTTTTPATATVVSPPVAIDAAPLTADATDQAASPHVGPGPDMPLEPDGPGKGSDKRPRPPVATGPAQSCHCIPTNAPDIISLCPTKGASLCRCDAANGSSLCPTPSLVTEDCMVRDEWECSVGSRYCPDRKFQAYRRPGRFDDACSGYEVPRWGVPNPNRIAGHLECDVCSGVNLDAFKGHEGEPCSGFYWRTGEPKVGKLAHCK